jgi:hypothetical protein
MGAFIAMLSHPSGFLRSTRFHGSYSTVGHSPAHQYDFHDAVARYGADTHLAIMETHLFLSLPLDADPSILCLWNESIGMWGQIVDLTH